MYLVLITRQYLIQADFLLIANREGLDISAHWNTALRTGIVKTFREAANRFVRVTGNSSSSGLRYSWAAFLAQKHASASRFWSQLRQDIFDELKTEKILESRDEKAGLRRPCDLSFIPLKFRHDGKPLIEDPCKKKLHLSFYYDSASSQLPIELKRIGVTSMTKYDFLSEIQNFLGADSGYSFLNQQSTEWHIKLSSTLREAFWPSDLRCIPIIPVRDGSWVTTSESNLYLDSETDLLEVPKGINLKLVSRDACLNKKRKSFFEWLDIKPCYASEVCKLIMELHNTSQPRERGDLVSDAIYLFRKSRNIYGFSPENLNLADWRSKVTQGKHLYVDHPKKAFAISNYASGLDTGIRMLHQDYLEAIRGWDKQDEVVFIDWLVERLQVSTVPVLIRDRLLTREFQYFKDHKPKVLLVLLRDNWDFYSRQLEMYTRTVSTRSGIPENKTVKAYISEMMVACTKGLRYPLCETVLPLADLKDAGPHLPFLSIDDHRNLLWLRFETFGVITQCNIKFYIRELKALASLASSKKVEKGIIQNIYRQLAARSSPFYSRLLL
jgi:hypothetical protein